MVSRNRKVGIEPTTMSLPAMDRVSVAFASLLDDMIIESGSEDDPALYLVCYSCSTRLCEVEHSDTMRVLLNTALAHTC